MGREMVLYPASGPTGEFPIAQKVRGEMNGPLPPRTQHSDIRASGAQVDLGESVDFECGSSISKN